MQAQSIPSLMTGINHWVVWKYEARDGKRTKVPYCVATGERASPTDPADWTAYEAAAACSKRYDGIGFVFSGDDPLVGIDLDGCRDKETGVIQEWARAIIGLLDSYTEVTPSGTGVHILCRGRLPPGGRRKGKIEIYETGRYFTVTGERLEERPKEPEERGEALVVFHDSVFGEPRSQTRPPNGAAAIQPDQWKIIEQVLRRPDGAALWRGENLDHPSASEGDWDLCGLVAWFAGPDASLIESVVRQSSRQREKWDTPRGSLTWIGQTVANRLRTKIHFFDWARPAAEQRYERAVCPPEEVETLEAHPYDLLVYNGPALMAAEIAEPEWLIEGFIARGVMTMLVGIGKIGKSVLGHQACVAGACAGIWLDRQVPLTRSLYVNWEDPLGLTRARAVQQFAPTVLPETYHTMQPPWGASFNGFLAWLEKFASREEIGLIVIDPLAIAAGWKDENDNSEVGPTLRSIQEVAQRTGSAILVVHHTRKSPGEGGLEVRGGSAIFAGIQGFLSFRRKGDGLFALDCLNKMPGEHGGERSLLLRRIPHTLTWQVDGEMTADQAEKELNVREMEALIRADPGITRADLAETMGVSETTLRRYVEPMLAARTILEGARMRREGDVGRTPKGLFWNESKGSQ